MSFSEIEAKLRNYSGQFGNQAHVEFSPMSKQDREALKLDAVSPKQAAVLVLLYPKDKVVNFVLTQRFSYKGAHSNQISLPGGKKEVQDLNLKGTALRETYEEIGVKVSHDNVFDLSEIYIPPSNFLVMPFVKLLTEEVDFEKDDFEVKEILEFTLETLIKSKVELLNGNEVGKVDNYFSKIPAFKFEGKIVWGATAMMLNELRYILLQ